MRALARGMAFAAVCGLGAPAAAAPTDQWTTPDPKDAVALSRVCDPLRQRAVCAEIACRDGGGLQLRVTGLRYRTGGRLKSGALAVDGDQRDMLWGDAGRTEQVWVAETAGSAPLFEALSRGDSLSVQIGEGRPTIAFTLRGSAKAILALRGLCRD